MIKYREFGDETHVISVVAGLGVLAAPSVAQQAVTVGQADVDAASACGDARDNAVGDALLCLCDAGSSGSVWGSGTYTADSNICAAAVHAGALGADGGPVAVLMTEGRESYTGSAADGMETRDWGSYSLSFEVFGVQVAAAGLDACGVMPGGAESYECNCPAGEGNSGSVWGAGPYTADSDICSAARHSGIIDAQGGAVRVLRLGGLDSYISEPSFGVETSDWGAYSSSITFDWNYGG